MEEETDAAQDLRHKLRSKEKRNYNDSLDEEIEGKRTFNVDEKLQDKKFELNVPDFVLDMKGEDFNFKYIQENGFVSPMVFHSKENLGMVMPPDIFDVNDVRNFVGARRILDVFDTNTQQPVEMTMKQWVKYYNTVPRSGILNVISLEFSHTGLEHGVEPPSLVRELDWVYTVWPPKYISEQKSSTNDILDMKYPKVRKYCLMSVGGCFTDFHVDFGGTSVWYHILKGKKIFWLIPPTPKNLDLFEKWLLSGKQHDVFFGDLVEKCCRIVLNAGDTFLMPTGWIHAVHTPEDSLVFGGNFLHTFSITEQLKVNAIEMATKVPDKFRYPFYSRIMWYAAKRYVECLKLDKEHKQKDDDNDAEYCCSFVASTFESTEAKENCSIEEDKDQSIPSNISEIENQNKKEESDKSVDDNQESEKPTISVGLAKKRPWHPVHLTRREHDGLRKLLNYLPQEMQHVPDEITDPLGLLNELKALLFEYESRIHFASTGINMLYQFDQHLQNDFYKFRNAKHQRPKSSGSSSSGSRSTTNEPRKVSSEPRKPSGLVPASMRKRKIRCGICAGCKSDNCGSCPCCKDMIKFGGPGKMKQSCRQRVCANPVYPEKKVKIDVLSPSLASPPPSNVVTQPSPHTSPQSNDDSSQIPYTLPKAKKQKVATVKCINLACVPLKLTDRTHVCRPHSITPPPETMPPANDDDGASKISRSIWQRIFTYLKRSEFLICMRVCRTWNRWTLNQQFWEHIDLTARLLTSNILAGVVRRQPISVDFSRTNISFDQLRYIIQRIPYLTDICLNENSGLVVAALSTVSSSRLKTLDLAWCEDVTDDVLCVLLTPPAFGPSRSRRRSRLSNLERLDLTACCVTDVSLQRITKYLKSLKRLNLSYCHGITKSGVEQMMSILSQRTLIELNTKGCPGISHLTMMEADKKVVPCRITTD